MITISEKISNMLNAPARRIDARVELYNCSALQGDSYNRELLATYYGKDGLQEFKVERLADDGKFFGFGVCQKLTVKLSDRNRVNNIHKGQVLEVSYGVKGDFIYPCALFQVEEVSRDENNNDLTITAYDFLYKANAHRVSELNLSNYTIRSFIAACAALLNLPFKIEPTDSIFDLNYPTGANFDGTETIREALNAVAEVTQTIFFVDWDWRLTFRRLKKDAQPVLNIDRSKYFELKNKTDRTLTAICHATELGDNVEAGNKDGVVQYVRNNPFWDLREDIGTLLSNALSAVSGITISQFDCSWRGNFALEIGDKISMTTKNGDLLTGYVFNDTLIYNGGLKEQTEWTFTEHNAETASNPVNLGDALKQTYARVNKAEGIIELVAKNTQELADGIEERIASVEISADGITQEVSRIERKIDNSVYTLNSQIQQTAESIESTVSKVETLEGEINTISSTVNQTAESIESTVSKVETLEDQVKTMSSTVNQTAGSITSVVSRIEGVEDDIETLESEIQQTAEEINLKVSKNDIISAINLSTESIDISSDKINLNGYVTVNDLSGNGTTTINGNNITTGTISADRINMSGAIDWSDLSSGCQSTIASYAGSDGSDADVPPYIKWTYIDSTEIRSPQIKGNDIKVYNTFQTIGMNGVSEVVTGYMGAALGMDASNQTTFGVALSNEWSGDSYAVGEQYIIVTNAGVRIQAGENRFIATPQGLYLSTNGDKAYYNGQEICAGATDYVVEQGETSTWQYRKWNSGIAECWCKRAISGTVNTAIGALYTTGTLSSSNISYPFTFEGVPNVQVTLYNNGVGAIVLPSDSWAPPSTTQTGAYQVMRPVARSTADSFGFNYYVIGKWK